MVCMCPTFFKVVTPSRLVGRQVYQRFGQTYCLHCDHFSPEDGDSMFMQNVGICLQVHTAQKTRSPPWELQHTHGLHSFSIATNSFPNANVSQTNYVKVLNDGGDFKDCQQTSQYV
ncbi:hypothetical protein L798_04131 [Zootermopsis nevadensis]|uniref:Uncharacterized protein n=1 Tax=Zootermopsis nevadensis TaxID=136037 RepID=A0A067RBE2_ZOONE|nr:hypothetical protein L798_04131 [Zootermopsis nevadensis]